MIVVANTKNSPSVAVRPSTRAHASAKGYTPNSKSLEGVSAPYRAGYSAKSFLANQPAAVRGGYAASLNSSTVAGQVQTASNLDSNTVVSPVPGTSGLRTATPSLAAPKLTLGTRLVHWIERLFSGFAKSVLGAEAKVASRVPVSAATSAPNTRAVDFRKSAAALADRAREIASAVSGGMKFGGAESALQTV